MTNTPISNPSVQLAFGLAIVILLGVGSDLLSRHGHIR